MTIYMNEHEWMDYECKIGDERILVQSKNIMTGATNYGLNENNGGIGGNMNHRIKRYHGWRGTTNDNSVTAMGLRRIEKIQTYKNGTVRIWLSEDLKPDAE